jgi:hypothetical protein
MFKGRRNILLFLSDIIEAIEKIDKYTEDMTYEKFLQDDKTKDAVLRNLEIIGEAVKNIPDEIKRKYNFVNWRAASGMRNKLIHEYFGVNFAIVWETIKHDLPSFKEDVQKVIKNES